MNSRIRIHIHSNTYFHFIYCICIPESLSCSLHAEYASKDFFPGPKKFPTAPDTYFKRIHATENKHKKNISMFT